MSGGTQCEGADWSTCGMVYLGRPKCRRTIATPKPTEAGQQVSARPHDSGSAANETVDGLDATTETLRRAAENTPSGAAPEDVENVPVFDRAGLAPKFE